MFLPGDHCSPEELGCHHGHRGLVGNLGLEQYEAAFRDNAITGKVLPNLTADDLKDLGVGMVGHRRTLLDAIAYLRVHANAKASPSEAPSPLSKPSQLKKPPNAAKSP